ncbi:hypothetical protein RMSM_06173 [Rhodopirellula maiorica SM1]|uniref:Uncharacterized protein n=1 Tax=Rhodopirellula maiorica SM1 TaxID=1265738 RepID=M5RBN4_9BACT|nr:hypothetical protein [Rhodopirellula maiorica]EMI16893.1 hypothetical protein RMSM_06173 [Rhodopirellula maiorica SM1]
MAHIRYFQSSVNRDEVDVHIDQEEIEFIGGPYDGLLQPCSQVDKVPRSVWLAFSTATLRFIGGDRTAAASDVRSAALYRLDRRGGKPRYRFVGQQILEGGSLA